MIKNYIEKLKQHPVEKRHYFANLFAGIVTVFIVLLWLGLSFFLKPLREKEEKPLFGGALENFSKQLEGFDLPFQDTFSKNNH